MIEDSDVKKGLGTNVFGVITVLVAFVAAASAFVYFRKGDEASAIAPASGTVPSSTPPAVVSLGTSTTPQISPIVPVVPVIPPVQITAFKNGTYSATGTYSAPSGEESIGVTLVLKNDVVIDASVRALATNPRSVRFQQQFVNNFASQVIGKKITNISLDNVSGSSLTPQGFNDAVTKIEALAKV